MMGIESEHFIFAVFFFVLGLAVGSFLNVVILRWNTGRTVGGRSGCGSCGKTLEWFELIPIISFIVQRGRCRSCRAKLSSQYPLVELTTGLVFLSVFLKFFSLDSGLQASGFRLQYLFSSLYYLLPTAYYLFSWCLLIVIFVYDLRHKIIPDPFAYGFAALALVGVFYRNAPAGDLLAGPVLFVFFFLIWLISRGRSMGLGDAKLALGLGWFLGLAEGVGAVLLAFWIGATVAVGLILLGRLNFMPKRLTIKSEIPFGPFLVIGAAIVFFFNLDIFNCLPIFPC